MMVNVSCLECSTEFTKLHYDKKVFCNRSCAATHNNRRYPKRSVEGSCKSCGVALTTTRQYCSQECRDFIRSLASYKEVKPNKVSVMEWRQRLKLKAVEYKGGCCSICAYDRCISALEFHHLDPNEKDFGIGSGNTKAWKKVKSELDKCILVCANCHREIHALPAELRDHVNHTRLTNSA